jgi:RNA polymerase sigma-70 factor (ECF subfamily)
VPASDADRDLHRRLLAGDLTATAEAAERFLPPVVAALRRRFARLSDPHLIDEAAADAVFSLLTKPDRYDPDKAGLAGYLTMSAAGDLKNRLAAERTRAAKRRDLAVELLADGRKGEETENTPLSGPELRDRLTPLFDDARDLEAAVLILEGVRPTARYAEVYGLGCLTVGEQRKLVKRHKDRITKVLQRHGAEAL